MARAILGVVAGLLAWVAIVAVAGVVMRGAWADYAAVADAMTFTLPMMAARLAIGALATVAAGWLAATIAERSAIARLAPGLILLLLFIPQHYLLWDKFPIWYHLTFLGSLVPLTWLGGQLAIRRA